jgi:hypothetical protein
MPAIRSRSWSLRRRTTGCAGSACCSLRASIARACLSRCAAAGMRAGILPSAGCVWRAALRCTALAHQAVAAQGATRGYGALPRAAAVAPYPTLLRAPVRASLRPAQTSWPGRSRRTGAPRNSRRRTRPWQTQRPPTAAQPTTVPRLLASRCGQLGAGGGASGSAGGACWPRLAGGREFGV